MIDNVDVPSSQSASASPVRDSRVAELNTFLAVTQLLRHARNVTDSHDRIADHSSRTAVRSLRESILRTRCALLLQYADRSLTGRRLISAADRDQFIEEFGQPTWDALRKSEKLEVVA